MFYQKEKKEKNLVWGDLRDRLLMGIACQVVVALHIHFPSADKHFNDWKVEHS